MTKTSAQDLQDEFLSNIRKGQEAVVEAIRTWAETVRAVTSKLPGVPAAKLPSVSVPFADKLPNPQEAVDSAYRLAEELLANQRKFAEDLLKVTAPLIPGNAKSVAARPAAKSEPKAAELTPAPRATFVAPAPQAAVTKAEPKPAAVVPAPKADAPKADAPKADAPKADAPKADAPKADAPKADAPKPAPAKSAPKAAPAASAPRTTAAKSAPRTTAKRTTPKKAADAN